MKTTTIFFAAMLGLSMTFVACKKKKTEDPVVEETPTNKAPTVAITAPTGGLDTNVPYTGTISATASDEDGTISKVEFYVNNTLVNTDTQTPFTYDQQTYQTHGEYQIKAIAHDNKGATTTSATVTITIAPLE